MSVYTLNQNINDNGVIVGSPIDYDFEGDANLDTTVIPEDSTDKVVAWAVDVSQIKCIVIEASEDMTLETNADDATGGNTLNLLAGEPYIWHATSLFTNLLTLDVTVLYITNTTAGTLKIRCKYDATP